MEEHFETYIKNDDIVISKYSGTHERIEVPGILDGKSVIRIGDYAFSEHRNLIEITLPDTVQEIGRHAFYNCRKLRKVHMTDRIHTIEDGAFKNCESLKEVSYQMLNGRTAGLKGLLSESNWELHITIHYVRMNNEENDQEKDKENVAKLIFPRYLHDYEENTSAKVINQVTYGAGVHYRECISEYDIDYRRYDELFHYVMANDSKETACFIALYRLLYPYHLGEAARDQYRGFLGEQLLYLTKLILQNEDMEMMTNLASLRLYSAEDLDQAMELAYRLNSIEGTRFFLQYKKDNFGSRKKLFEL